MSPKTLACAALLLAATAIPASAVTFQGTVPNGGLRTIGVVNGVSGQFIFTLAWTKRSADLDLVLECDGQAWGISATSEERFERLEVGLLDDAVCTLGISSYVGSSRFYLNAQSTGGNTLPLHPAGPVFVQTAPEQDELAREMAVSARALKRSRAGSE